MMRQRSTSLSDHRDIPAVSSDDDGPRNIDSMETMDTVMLTTMSNTPDLLLGPEVVVADPARAAGVDVWADLSDEIC
jgi:hypothetical protein